MSDFAFDLGFCRGFLAAVDTFREMGEDATPSFVVSGAYKVREDLPEEFEDDHERQVQYVTGFAAGVNQAVESLFLDEEDSF